MGSNLRVSDPAAVRAHVIDAERLGFESIWVGDHVVVPDTFSTPYPYGDGAVDWHGPFPEPLTWLSYAAAVTERIRLCTGVLVLAERNPVVLAKELATLDWLSGGRVVAGVGLGWLREGTEAVGVPWSERAGRVDEHIDALRALWGDQPASFAGRYSRFERVHCRPSPPGRIPIVIGGHSPAAARRAGRLGDGFFTWGVAPEALPSLLDELRRAAHDANRDADAIEVTAGWRSITGDDIDALAALGVERVVVPLRAPLADLAAEFVGQVAREEVRT